MKRILCFLLLVSFSCNTAKRVQKQEEKAFQKVLTTEHLFDKMVKQVERLYPCGTDTFISIINDTLPSQPISNPIFIPIYLPFQLDTIVDGVSIYVDSNGVFVKCLHENKVIRTTKTITVPDKRGLDICNKEKEGLINSYQNLLGAISEIRSIKQQLADENKALKSSLRWYQIAFFGLLFAVVLAIVAVIRNRKKIKI